MKNYMADLHIHSPHSIAVSQNINLDTLTETAIKKGLHILGTGDITQPDWRNKLKEELDYSDGIYSYTKGGNEIFFIIQTELEDNESIHHVVLLPDFNAAEHLQEILSPKVKNITGRWAGRPHVHRSPAELVEIIEDVGGICGPAHAFTPFKSIFRQKKFSTLNECYEGAEKKLAFLELGLSANTQLADRMKCLSDISFLSNSDAHSEKPNSLGRECNKFLIESPSFDEIKKACFRREGRKIELNIGLDPKLGKYYAAFCNSCRNRATYTIIPNATDFTPNFDNEFNNYTFPNEEAHQKFLHQIGTEEILCVSCKNKIEHATDEKTRNKKIPLMRLGVSERVNEISTWSEPHSPEHRPPYLNIIPLMDMIRNIKGIKSKTSKTVTKIYNQAIETIGTEYKILAEKDPKTFEKLENGLLSKIIHGFRNGDITYVPGGGGTFGDILFD